MRIRLRPTRRPWQLLTAICVAGAAAFASPAGASAAVSGAVTEYPLPNPDVSGQPRGITWAFDGKVWFVTGKGKLDRITRAGAISEFSLPNPAREITSGLDGNLWATQPNTRQSDQPPTNQIASISNLRGVPVVTEFPVVPGCPIRFCLGGITPGPDGNVWFTEPLFNTIGRITHLGVITEFPLNPAGGPPAHAFPYGITWNWDGNLWFALTGSNEIGRISPSTGATAFFPVPNPDPANAPCGVGVNGGITPGLDGNLWFSEEGGCFDPTGATFTANYDAIGRMTTSGTLRSPVRISVGANVQQLTLALDGNVWVPELGVNLIGRITPRGRLKEFSIPTADSHPIEATPGLDGGVWFSEAGAGKIGRIRALDGGGGEDRAAAIRTLISRTLSGSH